MRSGAAGGVGDFGGGWGVEGLRGGRGGILYQIVRVTTVQRSVLMEE